MNPDNDKIQKKLAKAQIKATKAQAKARITEIESSNSIQSGSARRMPADVGVSIHKGQNGSELIVTGLSDNQLNRLVPQVNREILITITEDTSSVRAGLMRFVREGIFQTIIKVVAGLIVGYLLLKFGLT